MERIQIKAITFDVFGTVVDWRAALIQELTDLASSKAVQGDWVAFTNAWKASYRPAMDRVNSGAQDWTKVDVIYRARLDELLSQYGLEGLTEPERDHLNRVWCRPIAWPDLVAAITRLKSRHMVSTLSNGNFAWLAAIAKHCALAFDCIITAENARAYKPDPRVYKTAIELLGVAPGEILMVACHNYDLAAAREAMDDDIIGYIAELDNETLSGEMTYSMITIPKTVTQPRAPVLTHFFNHQTHHRGQCHAMLTRLTGAAPALDLIYYLRET